MLNARDFVRVKFTIMIQYIKFEQSKKRVDWQVAKKSGFAVLLLGSHVEESHACTTWHQKEEKSSENMAQNIWIQPLAVSSCLAIFVILSVWPDFVYGQGGGFCRTFNDSYATNAPCVFPFKYQVNNSPKQLEEVGNMICLEKDLPEMHDNDGSGRETLVLH